MASQRGLVISCPVTVSGPTFELKTNVLDPQELRFSLLFWDKLNYPTNNLFSIALDQDAEFLASEGILERAKVRITGSVGVDIAKAFGQAHVHAYRTLDEQEPGTWSLGRGENSVSFPDAELENDRGALIQLYQAIPVPDKDVPLQDILEFRSKRSAELLALRYRLEAIYQRVVVAGDGALALNTEIGALEQAIAEHIKVSMESKMSFRNMSFGASLNVPAGVRAGLTAVKMGLGVAESLLVGAGAAIGFGPGISLKGRSTVPTPFQYISSYHETLF